MILAIGRMHAKASHNIDNNGIIAKSYLILFRSHATNVWCDNRAGVIVIYCV